MNNEYSFLCKHIEVLSSHNNLTDVVAVVHWQYEGWPAGEPLKKVSMYRANPLNINAINSDTFIPLSELSNSKVIEWVKESIGTEELATLTGYLDKMIDDKVNPKKRNVVLNK
jgi:hypothetical protein